MSEPVVVQPRNRVTINPATKAAGRASMPLAEVPVGDGSRRLGDLGDLTLHRQADNQRPVVCEVVFLQSVYKKVVDHLKQETKREHGGFLLGYESAIGDAKTPAVVIVDALAAKFTEGSPVQLTFTTDTWRDLDDEISKRYGDGDRVPQRVGWYHSHPNIRIFLSHWDLDVCRTYERRKYPVALVVDPIKDRGGFFIGGAKGYDAHAPQGFYEVHDLEKDSVVTWNNVTAAAGILKPELDKASGRNENEKPLTINHETPKRRRGAVLRQAGIGLMVVAMVAAVGYLFGRVQTEQSEIEALTKEVAGLRSNAIAATSWEMTIQPGERDLAPSEQVEFKLETKGVEGGATWTIDPKTAGRISASGVYKAPPKITEPTMVTVKASSVTDASKFAIAQVRLVPPAKPAVSVSLKPAEVQLGASGSYSFHAEISGTDEERGAGVKWTIDPPNRGKIVKNGVYVAPALIQSNATVVVSATSIADPSKSARATITLVKSATSAGGGSTTTPHGMQGSDGDGKTAGSSQVTDVAITAPAVAVPAGPTLEVTAEKTTFSEGESARFSASSGGAEVSEVTWSLEPNDAGSISPDGQYTAPGQIQPEGASVTVIAKSKDAAKTGKRVITLKPRAQAASNPTL